MVRDVSEEFLEDYFAHHNVAWPMAYKMSTTIRNIWYGISSDQRNCWLITHLHVCQHATFLTWKTAKSLRQKFVNRPCMNVIPIIVIDDKRQYGIFDMLNPKLKVSLNNVSWTGTGMFWICFWWMFGYISWPDTPCIK